MSREEKEACRVEKNITYGECIGRLRKNKLYPGIQEFMKKCPGTGCQTALGSAGKSTWLWSLLPVS